MHARSSIREMMRQIEDIAAQQLTIDQADWTTWCLRLETALFQVRESNALLSFRALELDPLAALRQAPFRPTYACDATSSAGRAYEVMLDRVARHWRTNTFFPIA